MLLSAPPCRVLGQFLGLHRWPKMPEQRAPPQIGARGHPLRIRQLQNLSVTPFGKARLLAKGGVVVRRVDLA